MRVTALNSLAESEGIRSGMLLTDAQGQLPSLKIAPANFLEEVKSLNHLAKWCRMYTPWIAPEIIEGISLERAYGIWLDITGCAHLFGGEASMASTLITRLYRLGFTARIGLAETPGAAWAVAHYGQSNYTDDSEKRNMAIKVVPPGDVKTALKSLPVMALRLPCDVVLGLYKLGLRNIGELLDIPRAPLANRFGEVVIQRLDQALGTVFEPISPLLESSPVQVSTIPVVPLTRILDIRTGLNHLLDRLESKLQYKYLGIRRLVFSLYHVNGEVSQLIVGSSSPMRGSNHLFHLFQDQLDNFNFISEVEKMIISAPITELLKPEQISLSNQRRKQPALGPSMLRELVDRLQNRLGTENVMRLDLRESYIPERSTKPVPVFHIRSSVSRSLSMCPRPIRLLPRPEIIKVKNITPSGLLLVFLWRRRVFKVSWSEGPERIAPEWWMEVNPWDKYRGPETRDYYRLEDTKGHRYWVFREGTYPRDSEVYQDTLRWYLHGFFA